MANDPPTPPDDSSRSADLSWTASAFDYAAARRLADDLDLSEPVAVALVRRGLDDADEAREFLRSDEEHDPFLFDDMALACSAILEVARKGGRITVHGDYDADGVAATAILVRCLREIGAEVDWLIPDRSTEGYGLTAATVEELRMRRPALVVTVDCGIACPAEVAELRAAGIEVIVTDHHEPKPELPDCPILHPRISSYPFEHLCGAGVALKLADALRSEVGAEAGTDVDLAALATVADMVPLVGENRRIVRQGLERLRGGGRPGMRALMRSARVDPDSIGAQDLSFRLAPRINAAGRLYRADAGVELMLTEDTERADSIAEELERANFERRSVERAVRSEAERALSALPEELAEAPAIVLAGEGWHHGVVGLVAGRMSDEHWKPTVLIGLDEQGSGKGSGRSVRGYDLLSGLESASTHLEQFGGHKMAAGLRIERANVDALREALIEHVESVAPPGGFPRVSEVDAFLGVGRDGMGLELVEQVESLGPFGVGNARPRFLVPYAGLGALSAMGQEGRHARFEVTSGPGRTQAVAFGLAPELKRAADQRLDLEAEVELNRWAGALEPRLLVRGASAVAGPDRLGPGCSPGCDATASAEFERQLAAEIQREPGELAGAPTAPALGRVPVDRRGGATIASVLELSFSGSTLGLCVDASRRRGLAAAADPARFGGPRAEVVCARCVSMAGGAAIAERELDRPGLMLADWGAIARLSPGPLPFEHVVLVDPPAGKRQAGWSLASLSDGRSGFLHLAWSSDEAAVARRLLEAESDLREIAVGIWRRLQARGGTAEGENLREVVCGDGSHPLATESAALALRSLCEAGVCRVDDSNGRLSLRSEGAAAGELEHSETFRAAVAERRRMLVDFDALVGEEHPFGESGPTSIVASKAA